MIARILFTLLLFFGGYITMAQQSFQKSLESISSDLCIKLSKKGKEKLVVLFITDDKKAETTISRYMADVISSYIVNSPEDFYVFDRANLSGIVEAKKLIGEGYIDATNAMTLGKILAVEAIVVGNYRVLSSNVSLTLKALDVNNGFVIAQSMKDLPADNDAKELLGIMGNRGFNNTPISSNEAYNNPEIVNRECEVRSTGDFCFTNNKRSKIKLDMGLTRSYKNLEMTLDRGQTQCFYNLDIGAYDYEVKDYASSQTFFATEQSVTGGFTLRGQIKVEKCQSKTLVIK